MNLFGPANGYTTTDPSVTFSGQHDWHAHHDRQRLCRRAAGDATAQRPARRKSVSLAPQHRPSPAERPSASAAPQPVGPSADITVTGNTFSQALTYPIGHWQVTVTSYATGLAPRAQQIEIVRAAAASDRASHLDVFVAGNAALTFEVTADGVPVPGLDGVPAHDGETFTPRPLTSSACARATPVRSR